jgi:hypothetical protein
MTCAPAIPAKAPSTCAAISAGTSLHATPSCHASTNVTAGLKWAPEMGPSEKRAVEPVGSRYCGWVRKPPFEPSQCARKHRATLRRAVAHGNDIPEVLPENTSPAAARRH